MIDFIKEFPQGALVYFAVMVPRQVVNEDPLEFPLLVRVAQSIPQDVP